MIVAHQFGILISGFCYANLFKQMENHSLLISIDALLEEKMLIINGQQALKDYDLAGLLQISNRHLRKKVKDNIERFSGDFLFYISEQHPQQRIPSDESKRELPANCKAKVYAFSWGGIMQAAGLFKTKRAVEIHLQLIRCYTQLNSVFMILGKQA